MPDLPPFPEKELLHTLNIVLDECRVLHSLAVHHLRRLEQGQPLTAEEAEMRWHKLNAVPGQIERLQTLLDDWPLVMSVPPGEVH
jgi:hypothetical protein